ncbi:MAG: DUF1697 domain-containing protein [Calditrichaeota bacterium]|nr:MAG: DUF1697 domain-containing protein [Calditrichota bacterium]
MKQKYIVLLRGINVSGQKKIKMEDLRSHLRDLHFTDIQTYIQSGNIIFKYNSTNQATLAEAIKNKIAEKYNFDVPVLVLTTTELEIAVANCPFSPATGQETKRIYFTFLSETPIPERVAKLKKLDYNPEQYILAGKTIYFYSPNGYGRAKMNNNFFENQLKVAATTRNWKTVHKLLEMAE